MYKYGFSFNKYYVIIIFIENIYIHDFNFHIIVNNYVFTLSIMFFYHNHKLSYFPYILSNYYSKNEHIINTYCFGIFDKYLAKSI